MLKLNFTLLMLLMGGMHLIPTHSSAEPKCDEDSSCQGQTIDLDCEDPCDVECDGTEVCTETTWNGDNVKSISCMGELSCLQSNFDIDCSPEEPCDVKCAGVEACKASEWAVTNVAEIDCRGRSEMKDRACASAVKFDMECIEEGCDVKCDGWQSCKASVWDVTNVKSFSCVGDQACSGVKNKFNFQCTEGDPCDVRCEGNSACKRSEWNIGYVQSVYCGGGDLSCVSSTITIANPADNFLFECNSYRGCRESDITIHVNGDDHESNTIEGITCGSSDSQNTCAYATFIIENTGESMVTVEEIRCRGEATCRDATFSGVGNVEVAECVCFSNSECNENTFGGIVCRSFVTYDATSLVNFKDSSHRSRHGLMVSGESGNVNAVIFILFAAISVCALLIALGVFIGCKALESKKKKVEEESDCEESKCPNANEKANDDPDDEAKGN